MNALFNLARIAAFSLVAMLAACGQKGPLYLPAKPAPVATPPAPPGTPSPDTK